MARMEVIKSELMKLALDGVKKLTILEFYSIARRTGLIKTHMIKEYLLTLTAQDILKGELGKSTVLELNIEKLKE